MLFIREHTSIPVPDVQLVFSRDNDRYIVMDLIPGRCLQDHWGTLNDYDRASVLRQLKQYLDEMRSLPAPTAPGPVDGSQCIGLFFRWCDPGFFSTYAELVEYMNHKLEGRVHPIQVHSGREYVVDRFSEAHPLVFTHQDISPRNLILDNDGKLWMIDWERAGWYPAYFEYGCIKLDVGVPESPVPEGWQEAALPLLPDYSHEFKSLGLIVFY